MCLLFLLPLILFILSGHPVSCGVRYALSKEGRKIIKNGAQVERIRRITGYLVGTLDRFNNAKKAEVKDRVKHSVIAADDCGCDLEAV